MKKRMVITIITIVIILIGTSVSYHLLNNGLNAPNGFTVTDGIGRTVLIPENPQKFVCIGPGCLRLYCYVGDTSKLIGIERIEITWDDYAGRPYILANLDLLDLTIIGEGGPSATPDAEKLVEEGPDVIFTMYNWDISDVNELHEKTNIPVVALKYGESEIFDENTYHSLELIGKVTGREDRAHEVIDYMEDIKADLAASTSGIADESKPSVYLGAVCYYATKGIQSTAANYSLFNAVNARNVVDEDSANSGITGFAFIDKEYLLELDPEIIIMDSAGLALVKEDYDKFPSYYSSLSAFKNESIFMQLPYNNYYTNIETALADAYYIGSVLYPDRFSDIDIGEKFDEISTEMLGKPLYAEMAEAFYGGYQQISFS